MKRLLRFVLLSTWLTSPLLTHTHAFADSAPTGYLITNDDTGGRGAQDTAAFFSIAADGTLSNATALKVGGFGSGGGFFASNRVALINSSPTPCAYFSQGLSNTIVGVQALTQTVVGSYSASDTDDGTENGVSMVTNGTYLYASFSTSASLATFAVQPGCGLQFISDIYPSGLNGGTTKGMALLGNLMVMTYGDGSIESFNISGGVPVSNGDAQNSTGFANDDFPDGVVITPNGHYAIFGDDSSDAGIEVSDISSGTLSTTVFYSLPAGSNSNNVLLSPDGTLLYVVNNTSGQVGAAFFDQTAGVVSGSCISPQLNGFDDSFSFLSTPVTQLSTGTGGVLYVAEFPSSIAILNVSASGGQCSLTEAASSPVADPNLSSLLSIAVLPIAQPGLYSPTSGSTLTGSSATFQWNGPPSATAFWIDVGSSAGGHDYYSSGSLPTTTLSATVNGLPTNGSTIYVTFYWLIGGSWTPNSYTFTAFNASAGAAVLTTPLPGSTLTGSTVTFAWSAGTGATAYWMDVGSTSGGHDYYSSGNLGNVLTTTVNGLPTNASTVYVTLYSLVGGNWLSKLFTYTAYSLASAAGAMLTPVPGSTLTAASVTFDWSAGSGASAYWLDVGSTSGGHDYYSSGNLGNVQTASVSGLPTDGSQVYATLYSLIGNAWSATTYAYTAFNSTNGLALLQTPSPGATLSGSSATFTWSSDASATAYWLDIGTAPNGNTVYSSGNLGNVLTTTVYSLPANGTTIYTTLYSFVGGQWLSTASTYKSGP